jgi:ribosomal protein S11
MNKKNLTQRILSAILLLFLASTIAIAQEDTTQTKNLRIISSIKAPDTLACPKDYTPLIDVMGDPVGCATWIKSEKQFKRIFELRTGSRFEVEPLLGTLISSGGKTILQYVSEGVMVATTRSDIGFLLYSNKGEILATNNNHSPNSEIAMSGDGYFVIVGPRKDKKSNDTYLTLYSPSGKEMFSKPLGPGRFPTKVNISNNARAIAITVATKESNKKGLSDLQVFNSSGEIIATSTDFKYMNSLIFIGDQQYLLAFSINALTLVDVTNGKIVWKKPNFYRLVGPFGVELSKDHKRLVILTAEMTGKNKAKYIWNANIVSITDGNRVGTINIAEPHQVSKMKVIEWMSDRSFKVKTAEGDVSTIGFE